MHHLVHLPEQIMLYVKYTLVHITFYHCIYRFGPLRYQWCMRFESKNAQIKSFVTHNFKNVPLSVAIHHQQWMCYRLATRPGQESSHFLYSGDEVMCSVYDIFVCIHVSTCSCFVYLHIII